MSIDWDALVLSPVMEIFGEGDARDPGQWPVYTPRGGAPFALRGAVFDAYYQHTKLEDDVPVTTIRPMIGVRLAVFAKAYQQQPAQNDTIYVPSVDTTYVVKDVQPDGHGHAKLILMQMAAA